MSEFIPPLEVIQSQLNHVARTHGVFTLDAFNEVNEELAEAVLDEAGKFSQRVLAPINQLGDRQGATCSDGTVQVPQEFIDAYSQFVDNGWISLGGDPQFGGQGMPELLIAAVYELFSAANQAFVLCPKLSLGGIHSIHAHGSEKLKQKYLEPMISGRFTGTMDLTEPSAGSDLGRASTLATPNGDHYLLRGRKIYITWGDHDMAENIIHLVLARTPGAPAGSRGLSLFLVPKFLLDEAGNSGTRNDMYVMSIEHKLGIHCSPTCVMSYGEGEGAVGYLVGQEGQGLMCMFTMMNQMRLGVGIQGVGIAVRAYQDALHFARERVQGQIPGKGEVNIVEHGDVRRMLLTIKAIADASRAVVLETAAAVDIAAHCSDEDMKDRYALYADLLTPVAKGWCTELAQEAATLGVQVFGGMGFVEETGVAQYMRDARILTIYEGTTGIQALDLVGRKILKQGSGAMLSLIGEIRGLSGSQATVLPAEADRLCAGADALERATHWITEHAGDDVNTLSSVAYNYLMISGTVIGGWLLMRHAVAATQDKEKGAKGYELTVRFYLEQIMPRSQAYLAAIESGGSSIIDFPPELM